MQSMNDGNMPRVLLTGATGYVGKHLLFGLLKAGYRVAVITRGKSMGVAGRIARALAPLGEYDASAIELIEGDLFQHECGLSAQALDSLQQANLKAFIHCAGMTRFDAHMADELQKTNVDGTRHAYALGKRLGVPNFLHISTAFVAGQCAGVFSENDLDRGQAFNNPYERSKFEAEKYLQAASTESGAPNIRIYRPSIVVGGHPLGESNHVSTVYTFIKALRFLRECCRRDLRRGKGRFVDNGIHEADGRLTIPLRIAANGGARINLVSVQQIVDTVIADLQKGVAKSGTHALLGKDMSLMELQQIFCELLDVNGLRFVDESDFTHTPRTTVETFFNRSTSEYQPYLLSDPMFPDTEKDRAYGIDMRTLASEFCQMIEKGSDSTGSPAQATLKHMALDTLAVSSPHDYFTRMVNGQMGRSLLDRIAYVKANIRFIILGDQKYDRVIGIDHGDMRFVAGATEDFSYELAESLFEDIIHGRADLRKSFFLGKVRIRGDMESALKFGFLFGDYLQHVDEHVIGEVIGL